MRKGYLLLLIVVGLFTLALYSTYAMFTASIETDNFVNLSASALPTETRIQEYERITINANDTKIIDFNINNNTTSNLYYGTWYEMVEPSTINDNIIIAKYADSIDETFGSINASNSKKVTLAISNQTDSSIIINIGVAYSETNSLNLPTNRELITGIFYSTYNVNLILTGASVDNGINLTNLITNGNFEDGSNGWSRERYKNSENRTEGTVVSNKYVSPSHSLYIKDTSASENYWQYQYFKTNIGNKIYVTLNTNILSGVYNIAVSKNSSGSLNEFNESLALSSDFTKYSKVYSATASEEYLQLGSSISNVSEGYIDDVMIVDLTESYGSGNEPSIDELNNLEYFDGTINYSNHDVKFNIANAIDVNVGANTFFVDAICDNGATIEYDNSTKRIIVSNVTSDSKCKVNFETKVLDNSGANVPVLSDSLIPVTYYNGNWVKADTDNINGTYKWYDYNAKKWANAVLVSSTNRNTYVEAEAGTVIPESEVLAYYVWIPRYKYKVFNITKTIGTDSYNAQNTGIDIVFEQGIESTGEITCNEYNFSITNGSLSETCSGSNGEYYTHPAFSFGDTELTGIWVGKFEISSSLPTNDYGGGGSTSLTVRIKPNVSTWRNNSISNFYTVIKNMQSGGNEYGLSSDDKIIDSHMLKNIEWGAVAYLTHSDYGKCSNGRCGEIGRNNYNNYMTGCGSAPGSSPSSVCNEYDTTTGMLASTTGNVYGIYDMGGGAYEYVMGNMSNTQGSYTYNVGNAGNNFLYNNDTAKYIDIYSYGTTINDQRAYNRVRLGDATGEVVSTTGYQGAWNNDYSVFVSSSYPWVHRGGFYQSASNFSGIFDFGWDTGILISVNTARATLVVY